MSIKNSLLEQADKSLPKLNYAVELQQYAASVGFDWPNIHGVIDKINEELNEVTAEINIPNNQDRLLDEIGDLLFVCTNLARHLNIDPEQALIAANQKFYQRFYALEQIIHTNKQDISQCSLEQLDNIWEQVKNQQQK
ncbi:MAG: nucleotide pyrophosphohydrolase [Methylophaga sp.]|nr:MAG: nucleotide pyrophosphohydrolase [Methylophaga sp.]